MYRFTRFLTVAALALALTACADEAEVEDPVVVDGPDVETPASSTLLDMVEGNVEEAGLTTLATALTEADLMSVLSSPDPITVFAPSDAAFEALPAGTLETLSQDENADQLSGLLRYHVIPGSALAAADIAGTLTFTTAQGQDLTVTATADGVTVTDAMGNTVNVVTPDAVTADNGVIHIVDGVLMPAEETASVE